MPVQAPPRLALTVGLSSAVVLLVLARFLWGGARLDSTPAFRSLGGPDSDLGSSTTTFRDSRSVSPDPWRPLAACMPRPPLAVGGSALNYPGTHAESMRQEYAARCRTEPLFSKLIWAEETLWLEIDDAVCPPGRGFYSLHRPGVTSQAFQEILASGVEAAGAATSLRPPPPFWLRPYRERVKLQSLNTDHIYASCNVTDPLMLAALDRKNPTVNNPYGLVPMAEGGAMLVNLHLHSDPRWLREEVAAAPTDRSGSRSGSRSPAAPPPDKTPARAPIVVMVQLDALGHEAARRSHPQLMQLLADNRLASAATFSMSHLWVNGYNTMPNMARIFCGLEKVEETCNLPRSLFKRAKRLGFHTAFVEGYCPRYPKLFDSADADKYMAGDQVFCDYGMWLSEAFFTQGGCADGQWLQQALVRYLRSMVVQAANKNRPAFITFPMLDTHKMSWLQPMMKDAVLTEMFRALDDSGVLGQTVWLLFGDHGLHHNTGSSPFKSWPPFSALDFDKLWPDFSLEFDHRNPVFEVVIGRDVLRRLPSTVPRVLEKNQHRLLGHADIHASVWWLLGALSISPSGGGGVPTSVSADNLPALDPVLLPDSAKHPGQPPLNFFLQEAALGRTCADANIPDFYCNCWVPNASWTGPAIYPLRFLPENEH